ncbi:MAG: phosphopantothenate/pantothenate synthetase [Promethearchaeota archaeon]|nr:MAG: phosphopantothenate/pantothenate synthetase [Candidatus Lokiarchaeota archaeon]
MTQGEKESQNIPEDHPRYQSLKYRHKIIDGMKDLIVAEAGLIAHGRGECFDYILGEKTNKSAKEAIDAATATLLLADYPVISVNGNVAALVPEYLVELSATINAPLEINLFYRKEGRIEAIEHILKKAGANNLLGTEESKMVELDNLSSNRRKVDPKGIKKGDVILVPLEDGDRTEKLKEFNKTVIAIDLNPLSRTSLRADITIIDNVIRVLPKMIEIAKKFSDYSKNQLKKIIEQFDNENNIKNSLDLMIDYLRNQKKQIF